MAIGAPSGNRPLPGGPRAGSGWRLRPSPVLVMTTPGLLRRYPPRDRWALAVALAGPLAASAVLLPFRASRSNTNAAQLLVVVAAAAAGHRVAGALATVGAAAWAGWPGCDRADPDPDRGHLGDHHEHDAGAG